MSDYATTGDGLLAGLQFLAAMVETQDEVLLMQVAEDVSQAVRNAI
jgi:phosphoglucosamine mutase